MTERAWTPELQSTAEAGLITAESLDFYRKKARRERSRAALDAVSYFWRKMTGKGH
ncbi:hypothetical protein [Flexibacterium corallicola]|uniref:hypothetical protein n=1 Tax=Flexibacterium corallicola TaxID=3037259 RepID=UPI00286F80BF|nr:hypothetical protein [Pseudovibrio sp. M1P-2-3]